MTHEHVPPVSGRGGGEDIAAQRAVLPTPPMPRSGCAGRRRVERSQRAALAGLGRGRRFGRAVPPADQTYSWRSGFSRSGEDASSRDQRKTAIRRKRENKNNGRRFFVCVVRDVCIRLWRRMSQHRILYARLIGRGVVAASWRCGWCVAALIGLAVR